MKKYNTPSTKSRNWIYGLHSATAALKNPKRKIIRTYVTDKSLLGKLQTAHPLLTLELVDNQFFQKNFPGVTHQGIALETLPLLQPTYNQLDLSSKNGLVLLLDQISDPHNIGAIIRSAAAFNATAVIAPEHNSPSENSTITKVAAGAFELVPYIQLSNLKLAIDHLKNNGYWIIGMDGSAPTSLHQLTNYNKVAILMGAEDKGIRPSLLPYCDLLAKITMYGSTESLNVSNAAAIAMYQFSTISKGNSE